MIPPEDLIKAARKLVGWPFRHQGRDCRGVDCSGLLIVAGRACGALARDFEVSGYPSAILDDTLRKGLQKFLREVPLGAGPRAGTVALFRLGGSEQHAGLVTRDTLIHSNGRWGRVVEQGYHLGDPWQRRCTGVFEFPTVAYP